MLFTGEITFESITGLISIVMNICQCVTISILIDFQDLRCVTKSNILSRVHHYYMSSGSLLIK